MSVIKQISGRDPIYTDVKYGEPKSFRCDAKMLFFTNHVFIAKSHDTAFYDRAIVIPFRYTINRDIQDYSVDARLASEIDAIATKAMKYYGELRMRNYTFSGDYRLNECVQSTSLTVDEALTAIDCFVKDCCVPDPNGCMYIEDAHERYCAIWGEISISKFSSCIQSIALERFGAVQDRRRKTPKGNPQSCLVGVTLRE